METSFRVDEDVISPDASIPCIRCGLCCMVWQPLMTVPEAEVIARHLGLSLEDFVGQYGQEYPLGPEENYLIKQDRQGCIFLKMAGDEATCSIYSVRPAPCRNWEANLGHSECREGLEARLRHGFRIEW